MTCDSHPTRPRLFLTSRGLALSLAFLTLTVFATSCAPRVSLAPGESLPLASFSENSVDVSIRLTRAPEGYFLLEASFTPPADSHLYSKDLPLTGMDGLGRPTLLEIPAESKIVPLGALLESVQAVMEDFELVQLPVYPVGEVTLSMPIQLPPGNGWLDETVSVTYMACNDKGCKPPVIGRLVPIRIPGADSISNP